MTFTVLLGNQSVKEPDVSTFSEIHPVKHIDDLLELLKLQDRYRHVYVSNVAPADVKKAATSRLHMHYKMSCPYTRKALYMIEKFQRPIVVAMHNADHPDLRSKVESYLQHTRGFDGSSRLTFPQFFYDGQPLGGTDTLAEHVNKIVENVSHDQIDAEAAELVRVINGGWAAGALVATRIQYFDTTSAASLFRAPVGANAVAGGNYKTTAGTEVAEYMQKFIEFIIKSEYPALRSTRTPDAALTEIIGVGKTLTDNVPNWQGATINTAVQNEMADTVQFGFLPLVKNLAGVEFAAAWSAVDCRAAGAAGAAFKDTRVRARLEGAQAWLAEQNLANKTAAAVRAVRIRVISDVLESLRTGHGGVIDYDEGRNYKEVRETTEAGADVTVYVAGAAGAVPAGGVLNAAEIQAIQVIVEREKGDLKTKKNLFEAAQHLYDFVATAALGAAGKRSTALAQALYFALVTYDAGRHLVAFGRRRKARKTSFGARKKSKGSTKKRRSNSFGKKKKTSIKKSRKTRGRSA
jgi:hypothetical protein